MGMSFGIGTVLFLVSFGYGLQYILIGKLVATEDSLITIEAFYPSETELNITYDDLKMISQIQTIRLDEIIGERLRLIIDSKQIQKIINLPQNKFGIGLSLRASQTMAEKLESILSNNNIAISS